MNILKKWRIASCAILFLLSLLLSSCASVTGPGYYSHVLLGEAKILVERTPISKLLADKNTSAKLRQNLLRVQEMREFAVNELALPVSDNFTSYVDTGREYVQWTLTATPEFSVNPTHWCFPIVGCSSYLVFYDEETAMQTKTKLAQDGFDVSVRGATAYSTAGWFADPIMNTFFLRSLSDSANLIFHESAHGKLRTKDDTMFSEAFATFVGQTGEYLWFNKHYEKKDVQKFLIRKKRNDEFSALLASTHHDLETLYQKKYATEKMRLLKQATFAEMKTKYEKLKESWDGYSGYDVWMAIPRNNADIAGENEYERLIPFFQKLFDLSGKNFPAFYERAEAIAELPKLERYLEIEKILAQ